MLKRKYPRWLLTRQKLIIEVFIGSIVTAVTTFLLFDESHLTGIAGGVWIIPTVLYLAYNREATVPTKIGAFVWSVASITSVGLVGYLFPEEELAYYLVVSLPLMYSLRLYKTSSIYDSLSTTFAGSDTPRKKKWKRAAVMLNAATKLFGRESRAYILIGVVYSALAVGRYQEVMESIEQRNYEYLSARAYANAARSLLFAFIALVYSKQKALDRFGTADEYIEKANALLDVEQCSACGKEIHKSELNKVINKNTGQKTWLCDDCYDAQVKSPCENCGEYTTETLCEECKAAQEQKDYYCSLLDISPPLTKNKIQSGYRAKVKQVHPDAGGTTEEFEQVKTAKEELLQLIQ